MDHYSRLQQHMKGMPVINTHIHHRQGELLAKMSLTEVFRNAYAGWIRPIKEDTEAERHEFIESMRHNSYYVWLAKAIEEVYDIGEPISPSTWDAYSSALKAHHADEQAHLRMLAERCGYEKSILDAYWEPGSNSQQPDVFAPTFRINSFLVGYAPDAADHNGNNCYALYPDEIQYDGDLTRFVEAMRSIIERMIKTGTVALKCASAYERGLDFERVSAADASRVFSQKRPSPDGIKAFQDYVFYEICNIAAEMNVPLQCHTGLGLLKKSSAIWMRDAIVDHPRTHFVLFHGNFPWTDDLLGLIHYSTENIWADLCWLPIISTTVCEALLHRLIEVGRTDRICWGCDTWTSEESYGALLAARHAIAKVLSERIKGGLMSNKEAESIAEKILYSNAKRLYTNLGQA